MRCVRQLGLPVDCPPLRCPSALWFWLLVSRSHSYIRNMTRLPSFRPSISSSFTSTSSRRPQSQTATIRLSCQRSVPHLLGHQIRPISSDIVPNGCTRRQTLDARRSSTCQTPRPLATTTSSTPELAHIPTSMWGRH